MHEIHQTLLFVWENCTIRCCSLRLLSFTSIHTTQIQWCYHTIRVKKHINYTLYRRTYKRRRRRRWNSIAFLCEAVWMWLCVFVRLYAWMKSWREENQLTEKVAPPFVYRFEAITKFYLSHMHIHWAMVSCMCAIFEQKTQKLYCGVANGWRHELYTHTNTISASYPNECAVHWLEALAHKKKITNKKKMLKTIGTIQHTWAANNSTKDRTEWKSTEKKFVCYFSHWWLLRFMFERLFLNSAHIEFWFGEIYQKQSWYPDGVGQYSFFGIPKRLAAPKINWMNWMILD